MKKTTENRIAQAELRTTGSTNPMLHPSGRYQLGIRLEFGTRSARTPYFVTDATTGQSFDAVGEWAAWAAEAAAYRHRNGSSFSLTFGHAVAPARGGGNG